MVSPASTPTSPIAPGTVLDGKYATGTLIAKGGMGYVLRARHELLKHDVAIKVVSHTASASAKERLLREARAMRALTSEHVVEVYDLGLHDGTPYIAMELLDGRDLRRQVDDDGPMVVPDAVDAILEACVAIAEAHAQGIVHRDIKPANLFLAHTRQRTLVKVLDFGISKILEPDPSDEPDIHATREDAVLGTPHFMSPEQLRNPATIDARTDVWALCVTLFYLLTGKLPFKGTSRGEIAASIFTDDPIPLRSLIPDAPDALVEVLSSGMNKRAEERLPDIHTLVDGLVPLATSRGEAAAARVVAIPRQAPKSVFTSDGSAESETTASQTTAGTNHIEPGHTAAPPTDGGVSSNLNPITDEESQESERVEPAPAPRGWLGRHRAAAFLGVGLAAMLGWLTIPRQSEDTSTTKSAAASAAATTESAPSTAPSPRAEPAPSASPAPIASADVDVDVDGTKPEVVKPEVVKPEVVKPATPPLSAAVATSGKGTPEAQPEATPPPPPDAPAESVNDSAPSPVDIDGIPIIR